MHYLRDGKVYLFATNASIGGRDGEAGIEHFWLCGECTLEFYLEKRENAICIVQRRSAKKESRGVDQNTRICA